MNKAILVGNLTKDPELKTTAGGISVCNFTLAVQRRFANAEGNREADFLPIIVWRAQAENCAKYLKKGSKAGVIGSIATRNYDDKDGNKRYVTEIVADEVEFLSARQYDDDGEGGYSRSDNYPRNEGFKADKQPVKTLTEIEDDLPF